MGSEAWIPLPVEKKPTDWQESSSSEYKQNYWNEINDRQEKERSVEYHLPRKENSWWHKYWKPDKLVSKQIDGGIDTIGLSVFLGATNLLFTGLSYSYNNNDIQNLKERAERIERILTSTCVQLTSLTNVGGTPGTAAVNAGILNSILAVSNPTCEA